MSKGHLLYLVTTPALSSIEILSVKYPKSCSVGEGGGQREFKLLGAEAAEEAPTSPTLRSEGGAREVKRGAVGGTRWMTVLYRVQSYYYKTRRSRLRGCVELGPFRRVAPFAALAPIDGSRRKGKAESSPPGFLEDSFSYNCTRVGLFPGGHDHDRIGVSFQIPQDPEGAGW
ncbi:hypothetical protein BC827DRAFT_1154284 [Russula dissimulans]|nr:hypothetical protein BC827DRAFT_1154284 [Russula dissimulans]